MDEPQQIDFSKLPDQPQIDLSKLPDKPVEQPKDEPWYEKVWHAGNTPLSTIPGTIYKAALPFMTSGALTPQANPEIANAGADVANSLTSPINLGMGLLSGGESLAGRVGLTALESGLGMATKAASVPFAAEGIHSISSGHPLSGSLELLGSVPGLTGLTSDALKAIRPNEYVPKINPSDILPDWLSSAKQTDIARPNTPKLVAEPTTLLEAQQLGEQSHHTPDAISQHVDSVPAIANGDVPKPIPDLVNSEPVAPIVPSDITIPRAGQARPTPDIGAVRSNVNSADQLLASHPSTADIPDLLIPAHDNMRMWVKDKIGEVGQLTQGLSKQSRLVVNSFLRGEQVPATPQELGAVQAIREVLDDIHNQYPEKVGYIEDYLPNIRAQDTGSLAALRRYFIGDKLQPEVPGTMGDLKDVGIGEPSSPFVKPRTGDMSDPESEINRTLPMYINAAGREIYLKPAVQKATAIYEGLPNNSVAKDLSKFYINNVSDYSSEPALHRAFNNISGRLLNMTARSLLDWNIGLHSLHGAEVATSIFPELGPRYTSQGLAKMLTAMPSQGFSKIINTGGSDAFNELAQTGLIRGEYTPPSFRTVGERYQSLANFLNMAEKLAKGTAYFGAKQKYLDSGMGNNEAMMRAIKDASQWTYTTDPVRPIKGLSKESNIGLGGEMGRLVGQFKGVPVKIIEQYVNIIKNIKNDPQKAARLIQGNALAIAATQAGIHAFHVNPSSLLSSSNFGPFGSAVMQIGKDAANLDLPSMLAHTVEWVTPGGQTVIKPLLK